MTTLTITSAKLNIVLPAGKLPDVDPQDPRIVVDLGGTKIYAKINPKAARKLKVHVGGVVLQGQLVMEHGVAPTARRRVRMARTEAIPVGPGRGRSVVTGAGLFC